MVERRTVTVPRRGRLNVSVPSAEILAERMLAMPEGLKIAVVRGTDGEGMEFYSLADPVIDLLYFPTDQRIDMERMAVLDAHDPREVRGGKSVVVPEFSDVIGFVRFPVALTRETREGRLTPTNYSGILETLKREILNYPEKWITPI